MEKAEKLLSTSGKTKIFEVLEDYIELKIENRITPASDEINDKLEQAEKNIKNIINNIVWKI